MGEIMEDSKKKVLKLFTEKEFLKSLNGKKLEDMLGTVPSLKDALKNGKELRLDKIPAVFDLLVALYAIYEKLPSFHYKKPSDITYYEFLMRNGRYDLPNPDVKASRDEASWVTVEKKGAMFSKRYILQRHTLVENYARILQVKYQKDVQIAHGHIEAMEEKLKRLNAPTFYRPGDLIYIDRDDIKIPTEKLKEHLKLASTLDDRLKIPLPAYAHVGVYIGNDQVIHFAGNEDDFQGDKKVHLSSLKSFLESEKTKKSAKDIYITYFPGDGRQPYKLYQDTSNLRTHPAHLEFFAHKDCSKLKCFSPAETLARAKEALLDNVFDDYVINSNNCEHFAFYCKTGQKISLQVNNIVDIIDTVIQAADFIWPKATLPAKIVQILVQAKNQLRG